MFLDDLLNGSRAGLARRSTTCSPSARLGILGSTGSKCRCDWWHGDADHLIPFAHGRHMVQLIPGARLHVVPGESHLGTLSEAEDILSTVLKGGSDAGPAPHRALTPARRLSVS